MQEGSFSVKVAVEGSFGATDVLQLVLYSQHPGFSVSINRVGDMIVMEREKNHTTCAIGILT